MKTKIRPIAMRATQEQFESIKDRINLPINLYSYNFKKFCWLTNDTNEEGYVSNLVYPNAKGYDRELHETFNADIFLEACGVEVEKVWKGSEMQYKDDNSDWKDLHSTNVEYRFKPQPDYSQEIEALQQKAKENGLKCVINFEKI